MSDCAHENMQLSMRDTRLFCDDCGRLWVSEDCVTEMRERVAKHLEARAKEFEDATEHHIGTSMALIYREEADRVRTLPIDPETGVADE